MEAGGRSNTAATGFASATHTPERRQSPPRSRRLFRFGRRNIQPTANLPQLLAFSAIAALNSWSPSERRPARPENEPFFPEASLLTGRKASATDSQASVDSDTSDHSLPDIQPVPTPSGAELIGLPDREEHLANSQYLTLCRLLTRKLQTDELYDIPAGQYAAFCQQAIAEVDYLSRLTELIADNMKLMTLHEISKRAIDNKLDTLRQTHRMLRSGFEDQLKVFESGQINQVDCRIIAPDDEATGLTYKLTVKRTEIVHQLINDWAYLLRNMEEWRIAMPAPSELITADLPKLEPVDSIEPVPASQQIRKLGADAKALSKCWQQLKRHIDSKQVPLLVPVHAGAGRHNAALSIEENPLPPVYDLTKCPAMAQAAGAPELPSVRLLPTDKLKAEFKDEYVFETEALAVAKARMLNRNPLPEGCHAEKSFQEKNAFTPRHQDYFHYHPVARNVLSQLCDKGIRECRALSDKVEFFSRDKFVNGKLSRKQKRDLEDYQSDLKAIAELWHTRIPSLQEAVDLICEGREEQERERLLELERKRIRKSKRTLSYQTSKLSRNLSDKLRGAKSPSPSSTPPGSPLMASAPRRASTFEPPPLGEKKPSPPRLSPIHSCPEFKGEGSPPASPSASADPRDSDSSGDEDAGLGASLP